MSCGNYGIKDPIVTAQFSFLQANLVNNFLPPPTITTPHSTSKPSVLGIFAVVLCGCVLVASVLGLFAVVLCGCVVVAASVVCDTLSLLWFSVGLAPDCSLSEVSEAATEKRKQKLNMIN